MRDRFAKQRAGLALAALGALLLVVAALGQWTALGNFASAQPRTWERYDPTLKDTIENYAALVAATERRLTASSSDPEVMSVLFDTVTARFTHRAATHTVFSNWLLYLAGLVHPAFSYVRNPASMVAKGRSLLCGQSSYLLLSLALDRGIRARHVGLDGHVVMEAWYDSDWHLYDPDKEVMPVDSTGEVLSVEKLALNRSLLEKYYGRFGYVDIVGSRENNTYMSYPEGAWFEWKSTLLAYLERVMEVLKFAVPLTLIALGLWLARRRPWRAA